MIFHYKDVFKYLEIEKKNNYRYLKYAFLAVIVGTIAGDYLMFYTVEKSNKINLPIAFSLIHLVPIFTIGLVYFWFNEKLNYKAIFGIILAFIGTIIAIFNHE
jgi:drug/metabolite transporter (DMT)-like permease